jgi:hypothetical protein
VLGGARLSGVHSKAAEKGRGFSQIQRRPSNAPLNLDYSSVSVAKDGKL